MGTKERAKLRHNYLNKLKSIPSHMSMSMSMSMSPVLAMEVRRLYSRLRAPEEAKKFGGT